MHAPVPVLLWKKLGRPLLLIGLPLAVLAAAVYAIVDELRLSRQQAARIAALAGELRFGVEPGPAGAAIRYSGAGPYDERLGYRQLPRFIERLAPEGYAIGAQARMSPELLESIDRGLFATYREKNQAGLELRDCRGDVLHGARFPERAYERFESVPPLLVDALLFIEDRDLLDAQRPALNPAIDWSRLGRAVVDQTWRRLDATHAAGGGSTLATQMEKYRHSPEGRTDSPKEKLRQIASASLRAYLDGEQTLPRRRQIVVDYLNTVPLAARPGFGEVNGLGDALWVWHGRDFGEVNRLLAHSDDDANAPADLLQRQALAFKQALSLMVAQRRPSYYLGAGRANLARLTDSYLRVMADASVIAPALRDAALPLALRFEAPPTPSPAVSFVERKAATAMRGKLSGLLDVPRAYDLDRLDLAAASSLDGEVQRAATRLLSSLRDPAAAKAAGLHGPRLLQAGDDPGRLAFSFSLYERGEGANLLRVQTDNVDQPFDINDGARLDLGSTAKLRTLISYLELVAALHGRWSGLSTPELAALKVDRRDAIGRWASDYLARAADHSLQALLDAALERSYSASPAEDFFTGGGVHRFENFENEDDHRVLSVREAFTRSVNLVFIRLMRDVVQHVIVNAPGFSGTLLDDPAHPARQQYLARFADIEGREFIARFHAKYRGNSPRQAEDLLLDGLEPSLVRLASVFGVLEPAGGVEELLAFLALRLGGAGLSRPALQDLHERYGAQQLSLADRGYLAGLHPLKLWLAGYLRQHPGATLEAALAASRDERQAAYDWLFRTSHKSAQDLRIRSVQELDAFAEIQRSWRRLGYPFDALTPSYATAIGASGDRPAALAELMGIIVNRGLRLPVAKIESLVFARDTPYETRLHLQPPPPERVLPAAVAEVVRRALIDVVERGTARRLKGALLLRDGSEVELGGKTGTGDHRFDVHGRGGRLISSRVVNRSATLVFLIGERHFGTLMVYVHEPHAADYRFTSALPAQLLKALAPALLPLLEDGGCAVAGGSGIGNGR